MNAVIYIHGKGGSATESEHYKPLFPDSEVIGTNKGHHHIANQKVGLRHCHIVLLGGF